MRKNNKNKRRKTIRSEKQRKPAVEVLEKRLLLSASEYTPTVSLNTIHQYGTALFGQGWQSDVGLEADSIQQHIHNDTWRSMLNDSPAPTIASIRQEAQYLGAENLQAQVDQALASADLTSIDIRELDWLQEHLPGPAEQFDYFADGQGDDDSMPEGESDPLLGYLKYQSLSAYEGDVITPGQHGILSVVIGFSGELPDGGSFTVPWQTVGQTATPGVDFTPTSGSVTFSDGAEGGGSEKTVPIVIINDTLDEPDETFKIVLQGPVVEGKGEATVTIYENDLHVSIFDAEPVTEGDEPFVLPPATLPMARFRVTLSSERSAHVSIPWRVVSVDHPMMPATPGVDFFRPTTGNPNVDAWLEFEPGETEKFIELPVYGDRLYELTEYFYVEIASEQLHHILYTVDNDRGLGTIHDNDPYPELSVDDVSVEEDAGTATLTVTMTNRSSFPVSFDWVVADQTAIRPDDYDRPAISGTTTIPAGGPDPHLEQFVFTIVNDQITEPDETFRLTISNAVNASITKGTGVVTILANDPQVDIDVDSNNNGTIEEADDPIEMSAPGKVVLWNRDDDNGNGVPDYLDVGPLAHPDDDLEPVNLSFIHMGLSQDTLDRLRIGLTINQQYTVIRIWDSPTKNNLIDSGRTWRADQVPTTLFMEGVNVGDATLLLRLYRIEEGDLPIIFPDLDAQTVLHSDSVLVTVNYIDLTGHTPYTDPFQLRPIAEADEENPGVHIRRNGDDDNGNGIPDRDDTTVANENDLILVRIDTGFAAPIGLRFELERSSNDIRVWTQPTKVNQLIATNNPGQITLNWVPANIWVEWVTPGTAPATATLDIRLIDNVSDNVVATDRLVFHPFTSVVIALGGETQVPSDPADPNHGTFQAAIDLYREGYDVHMYDEDEIGWESPYGLPYQEVVSAIQSRGVSHVAIFGYSHGGGSTYELAWALNENVIGNRSDITLPFTIPFTSYIDAITDSWIDAENRRPLLSQYHLNQYQQNSAVLNGGPSNADEDLNRSNLLDPSGQPVVHTTIDDHPDVLELLRLRLRQRVPR